MYESIMGNAKTCVKVYLMSVGKSQHLPQASLMSHAGCLP